MLFQAHVFVTQKEFLKKFFELTTISMAFQPLHILVQNFEVYYYLYRYSQFNTDLFKETRELIYTKYRKDIMLIKLLIKSRWKYSFVHQLFLRKAYKLRSETLLTIVIFFHQLIDDLLDFRASSKDLGKPAQAADLKLGLATAPGN